MTRIWTHISASLRALEDRERVDQGSGSVDTAIVVGLVAVAALGLAGLMTAAIKEYGGKIP